MEPSAAFLKKMADQPQVLKMIERFKKEFKVYSYLSDHIPLVFTDKDWNKLIQTKSIDERVTFWNFVAITQRREELDLARKQKQKEIITEHYRQQEEIYNRGGMGYGPGLYRFMLDPFAQMKSKLQLILDARQYNTLKMREQPTLALDFQYIPTEALSTRGKLASNMRIFFSENRIDIPYPLPLCVVNADRKQPDIDSFFSTMGNFDREKDSVYFSPPVHSGNPFLNDPSKEVVYISRFARDMLDGPLVHDAYILPITFDYKRESLLGGRNSNLRVLALPIKKYVKWQSGPMFLPFTSMQRMFNIVSQTGGDWHLALHQNISKRHLIPHDANRANDTMHKQVAKFRVAERKQVALAIKEALGENS